MTAPGTHSRIRVLVVDDSAAVRALLTHVLESDPRIEVVGGAGDGIQALDAVNLKKPDIVTMDVNMPRMSGLEATRRIMETWPVPIVIVTGCSQSMESSSAFRLLEAGALAVIAKPEGPGHARHEIVAREMVQTVKSMSEVKVVKRWPHRVARPAAAPVSGTASASVAAAMKAVVIGASTGGPIVLKTILAALPKDFPVPVLVVQHIAAGFAPGMIEWLSQATGFRVRLASHGERVLAATVYVAPDSLQMKLVDRSTVGLFDDPPEHGHRPSVSCLFRSAAQVLGREAVGVLLTGMGRDGAAELRLMRDRGALTIAQDEESSVVHGMPREAIALQGATHVLAPQQVGALLAHLANHRQRSR